MLAARSVRLLLLFPSAIVAAGLDDFHWREECEKADRWTPQVAWLGNPSPTASVTSDGQIACFRVDEPGKGMKWSASMPLVSLEETPWLVARYRAENLNTQSDDYLIYLDDRIEGKQLHALRLCDALADGQWRTVAVDVTTLTNSDAVYALAVQVQATEKGRARLWLDWLAFTDEPPKDAQVIQRAPAVPPKPDWIAPLAQAKWNPRLGWLPNPAPEGKHSVERKGDVTTFRVAEPGRGMKWSWDLPEAAPLEGHRCVSMRYRAIGLSPHSDYALCVLGKPRTAGLDYTPIIPSSELIADSRWHTLNVDIRAAAARFPTVGALALQVQAAAPDAALEVSEIRFLNALQPSKLADLVDWKPGASFDSFKAIPLGEAAKSDSAEWRRHLRLADWFTAPDVTAHGIPFAFVVPPSGRLAATGVRAKGERRFPSDLKASEVYLLLLAAFIGPEEPVFGGGKFRAIRDLDRFRLRLEYADGTADECLPMNVATKQFGIVPGPQVLVAAADPAKPLKAIVLRDACKQAAFAVAAITARTAGARGFADALEETPPLRLRQAIASGQKRMPREADDTIVFSNDTTVARLRFPRKQDGEDAPGLPELTELIHRPTGWNFMREPHPLLDLYIDGKKVPAEDFKRRTGPTYPSKGVYEDRAILGFHYSVKGYERLSVLVFVTLGRAGISFHLFVDNAGDASRRVAVIGPKIGPFRVSEKTEESYYLLPKCGAAFDNRPCSYRQRFCGLMPAQFIHAFSPKDARGIYLSTVDARGLAKGATEVKDETFWAPRLFTLEKKDGQFTMGVDFPEQTIRPGDRFLAPTVDIALTDGDWHYGLDAYSNGISEWYDVKPLSPRKPWFRDIFNFRQRFLHGLDPLYDAKTGELHLERAVEEAKREFGGIDYLHLFDWGNCGPYGRIYGRTGDYSPYDYIKGGREALRNAIAGVQKQGVPVGLYIEGYLLTARGKLGQAHGKDWQIISRDGKPVWWPGNEEMMICPGVEAWREVQASTYETKVKELGVDGMYIDQFGFADPWKDCYSDKHGHPVPSYPVVTERDATKLIRERVEKAKPGVAIYTEETPVDVTTPFQDGSFTYAMSEARRTQTLVPINMARFAFPDFKTIEILICDKPTGSWATGVKWVFFNGEAIWLEGPPDWFEPETREAIRRCYRVLRKHKDAFTGLRPVPLVPTEMGGVWANKFPSDVVGQAKTVYTLYNARHRTVRGEVLRIPHEEGASYYDEWNERPASVRRDGKEAVISLEIGPNDVGCLVVQRR
jgi:hypothetical protein